MTQDISSGTVPLTHSIPEVCHLLRLGVTSIYELCRKGDLDGVKLGRRTVVTRASIERLLAQAPRLTK